MKLAPDETLLLAATIADGLTAKGDATYDRIEWLIGWHLHKIAVSPSGWEALFLDPDDGRFWEKTYPHSEMHGGGPPLLQCIDAQTATLKYGLDYSTQPQSDSQLLKAET